MAETDSQKLDKILEIVTGLEKTTEDLAISTANSFTAVREEMEAEFNISKKRNESLETKFDARYDQIVGDYHPRIEALEEKMEQKLAV